MDYTTDTAQVLQHLIHDAEVRAEKAYKEVQFFRYMLDTYQEQFAPGAPTPEGTPPSGADDELVERMKAVSYRQMVRLWADSHDGRIAVKELVGAAVSTGRFESRTKAHRTIWSAVSQAAKRKELERVAEGVYQTRPLPLTDEQRRARMSEAEAFRDLHNLPTAEDHGLTLFTEPNMAPLRREPFHPFPFLLPSFTP